VDSRRFAGQDTTVVSPAFSLDLPGFGPQSFKVVVHSATTRSNRGRTGFRIAKGRGRVELKCDAQLPHSPRHGDAEEEFEVVLDKPDGSRLGVDLSKHEGEPWCVSGITGGLIQQWNHEHPERAVAIGDQLMEANGIRNTAALVKQECTRSGVLTLKLQRPSLHAPGLHISFGVGCGAAPPLAMHGPVLHRFTAQTCCGLPRSDEEFDFLAVVDKVSKKVSIHIEVATAVTRT